MIYLQGGNFPLNEALALKSSRKLTAPISLPLNFQPQIQNGHC